MPIISQETWDKFSPEEKEKIRKKYQYFHKVAYHGAMESYETLFPEEALHPQPLTYEDVARELFMRKKIFCFAQDKGDEIESALHCEAEDWYHYPLNCTSQKQAEKLLAINKLLNVAKFLNKDWKPDWEDGKLWTIGIEKYNETIMPVEVSVYDLRTEIVYFHTEELAKQCVAILGEETVRLALSSDY